MWGNRAYSIPLTGKKKSDCYRYSRVQHAILITETIQHQRYSCKSDGYAGIREPQNAIEKEGIDLVWESLTDADVVIILLDCSKPLTNEDKVIIDKNRDGNIIAAINKIDLPPAWEINTIEPLLPQGKKDS